MKAVRRTGGAFWHSLGATTKNTMIEEIWGAHEWDSQTNYVVLIFEVKPDTDLSECRRRFFDFKLGGIFDGLDAQWEDRGSTGVGAIHGRYAEFDDDKYEQLCAVIQLVEDSEEPPFDEVFYFPREIEDVPYTCGRDARKELHVTWGSEYMLSRAANKVATAMDDDTIMGGVWLSERRDDGTLLCRYMAVSDKDFVSMVGRMRQWKRDNGTAFTEMRGYEMNADGATEINVDSV